MITHAIGAACVLALLSACASTPSDPVRDLAYQTGARQVVLRYIHAGSTDEQRATRALRIREAVGALQVLLSPESSETTLETLRVAAEAEIAKASISPPDKDLLLSLVAALEAYLRERVDAGVLSEASRVKVAKVFDWIGAAATTYHQPPVVE
jgi:hypothetical protein